MFFPPEIEWSIPEDVHPGAFGALRKHDHHTGVDLYVPEGTPVYALADGVVVDVSIFTGPNANPPCGWWEETHSVTVYHRDLKVFILYGEITPCCAPDGPVEIHKGDLIGHVKRVIKHDKGKPTSMLHLEAYSRLRCTLAKDDTVEIVHPYWKHGEPTPDGLLDPTPYIKQARGQ